MDEPQSTSRRPVLLAGLAFVVALTVFVVAVVYMDGLSIISGLASDLWSPTKATVQESPVASSVDSTLSLPSGVTPEFAYRLWQEQVDSQETIGRLIAGDVTALQISRVQTSSAEATLSVTVLSKETPTFSGAIHLRRLGDRWFVESATSDRTGAATSPPRRASIDEVDVALLNTIFAEQSKSQRVFDEYVAGTVHRVSITRISKGPRTVTIDVAMSEDHGVGKAQIILLRDDSGLTPRWFLARFVKLRDYNGSK